ncbi:MAG: stage II sporulation protein M [Fimbriimonadales bacterium]|nr:MAG: membrane protein [Fimbriimonadales bacterium]
MNVRRFVERRQPRWERFEQLLDALQWSGGKGLDRAALDELGRLYRQTAADLAYARQQGADARVVEYLNALMGRAHGLLYRARRGSMRSALRHFWYGFPAAVRRRAGYVWTAIALTLLGALIPFLMIVANPAVADALVSPQWRPVFEQWKSGVQRQPGETGMASIMSSFYFVNNSRVAMLAFGLGVFWGIPTVYLLMTNGFLLGTLAGEMYHVGKLGFLLVSIYPHGVPELGAVFLCGGAGLMLGRAMIAPGDFTRSEAVRQVAPDAFLILAGSLMLILIAAFTEAFFSFYAFPSWTKFLWGTVALVALLGYLLGVREAER